MGEDDLQLEVNRLREELEKSVNKLETWKQKAQQGVDELRRRVIELTSLLEKSEQEKAQLMRVCSSYDDVVSSFTSEAFNNSDQKWKWMLNATFNHPPRCVAEQELETYKRRTETTLRLQTKNCEVLQHQVNELQTQVKSFQTQLNEKSAALQQRDETLRTLSARLDEVEREKKNLEEDQRRSLQGLDMERVNSLESRLEVELQKQSEEFRARESLLHQQHNEEIQRLIRNHENEMRALQEEYEVKFLNHKEPYQPETQPSKTPSKTDEAYSLLFEEKERLERENKKLKASLERVTKALETREKTAPVTTTQAPLPLDDMLQPQHLEEAKSTIEKLNRTVLSLSSKLLQMKEEKKQLQERESSKSNEEGLTAQQLTYLKSILKQMLTHRMDDRIFSHTLPVVSTLVSWSEKDVSEIRGK